MIQTQEKVADIVTQYPKTADVFRKYGIDFCCGGQVSILKAVEQHPRIDVDALVNELEQASQIQGAGIDTRYLDVPSLIQYIQSRYHDTLRAEFKQLSPYVTKLAKVHGPQNPHLIQLKSVYDTFKDEMLAHIEEEEQIAFPKLVAAYQGEQIEDLEATIDSLISEHLNAGQLLQEIRQLTDDFETPSTACGTWRLVYQRIEDLEKETHAHVHIENHVLFPKVEHLR
ncbi:iron-sulfur cluster repair di-iron protein ScdA [Staphylococcus schleiferi]|uniref:Cell wall biosynthesis protein ScdA n=1 Tax=Staphylococcus schleiferi TaxID=1295 RepID=A0A7Z7QNA7_STASC|nr:iron-sulfur cluster repair di-iron protein ScdA [Staphylococcus schleiferi]RTX81953.1 iron-sulfur cluster repair di-iron protein ScdA [Staphylococcus schleiferi subsp. schleiferi]CAD7358869.1 cell wall biosynthesis protein ScdA [Staphylococcus schleiferi]SUM86972.1 cell wall biosynthesis protein ScdA [Staphylococcus schleiferi]